MAVPSSAWPDCPEPEILFAKALMIYGPIPSTGWSCMRDRDGRVIYVVARTKESRKFSNAAALFFGEDVRRRYAHRNWTDNHCVRVGMMWKNQFNKWLWEKIDANRD